MTATLTTPGPLSDADVPRYVASLGLPGLADIHVHFMPDAVLRKVWAYFDHAEVGLGQPWPITYRQVEEARLAVLRRLGVLRFPSLNYAHKPGMAAWLNDWSTEFAQATPEAVRSGTFYPEEGVTDLVERALADGVRIWKVHVQVGGFTVEDPALVDVWRLLEQAGTPVVLHAGSGPQPGEHTGPGPVARLLDRHPLLQLVIAHCGLPEYDAFADLAERFERVHLDTTMVATDFTNAFAPLPPGYRDRLGTLVDKVVLGTDFPNIPYEYAHQITALTRLDLGDEWMRKVLWDNGSGLMGPG